MKLVFLIRLSLLIILLLGQTGRCHALIKTMSKVVINEDSFVLMHPPHLLTPIDDSLVIFAAGRSKLVIANYLSGSTKRALDLDKQFNLNVLAAQYTDIDTSDSGYIVELKLWEQQNRSTANITSIQKLSLAKAFITFYFDFPFRITKQGVNGAEDTIVRSAKRFLFAATIDLANYVVEDLYQLREKNRDDAPSCGCYVYNERLYMGKYNINNYKGKALSCFTFPGFQKCKVQPALMYPESKYSVSVPFKGTSHFIESGSTELYFDARNTIFELNTERKIADLSEIIPDLYDIISFSPIEGSNNKWLVQYLTTDFFDPAKERTHFRVVIDLQKKQFSDFEKVSLGMFRPIPVNKQVSKSLPVTPMFLTTNKDNEFYYFELLAYE